MVGKVARSRDGKVCLYNNMPNPLSRLTRLSDFEISFNKSFELTVDLPYVREGGTSVTERCGYIIISSPLYNGKSLFDRRPSLC